MFAKTTKKSGAQSQGNSPHKKSKIFGAFLNSSYQALQQHNQLQQNLQSIIGEKMKEIVKLKKDKKSEELRQKLATQINVFLKNIDTHQLMDLDDEATDHLKNFTQINRDSILTPLHNISGIEDDECSTPKFKREEEVPSEFDDFDASHHKPGEFELDSARHQLPSDEKAGPRYGRMSSNGALGTSSLSGGLHTGPHSSRLTEDRLMQTQHLYYARNHNSMIDSHVNHMNRTMRSGGDGTGGGVSCYSNPSSNQSFLKNELQSVIQKNLNQKTFVRDLLKLTKKHNLTVKKQATTPDRPSKDSSTPQQPETPSNLINLFSNKLKAQAGIEETPDSATPDAPCTRCDEFQTSYNSMMVLLLETLNDIIHVAPSIFSQNSFHDHSDLMHIEEHKYSTGGYDETPHIQEVEEREDKPMVVLYDIDTQTDFIATRAAAVQVDFTQKLNRLQNELKVLQIEQLPLPKPESPALSVVHPLSLEVAGTPKEATVLAPLKVSQVPALSIPAIRKAIRSTESQTVESPKLQQQQVKVIQQNPELAAAAISHIVEKEGPAKKITMPSPVLSPASASSMGSIPASSQAFSVGVIPQTVEKKVVQPSPEPVRKAKYQITNCAYSFHIEASSRARPRSDSDTQTERDVKITPVKNKMLQTDRMMMLSRDSQTEPEPVIEPVVIPTEESEAQTLQSGVIEMAEGHAQTEIKQFISIKSQTFHAQYRGQITQTETPFQAETAAAEVQTAPQQVATSSAEIQTSVTGEIKQVVPTVDANSQAEALSQLQEMAWREVQCQTIRAGLLQSRNQDAQTAALTSECSEVQTEGQVHEARDCQTEMIELGSVQCQTDEMPRSESHDFGAQMTPYVNTFGVQVDTSDPPREVASIEVQAGHPLPETESKELQIDLRPETVESETQILIEVGQASAQADIKPLGSEVQTQVSFRPTVLEFSGQADIRLAGTEVGEQADLRLPTSDSGQQTNLRLPCAEMGMQANLKMASADMGLQANLKSQSTEMGQQTNLKSPSAEMGQQADLKLPSSEFGLQTNMKAPTQEFGLQASFAPKLSEASSQAELKPICHEFEQQFEFKLPALEAESQTNHPRCSDTGSQAVAQSKTSSMQVTPSMASANIQVGVKPIMVDAPIMAQMLLPTGIPTAVQTDLPSVELSPAEEVSPELSERYCQTEAADLHIIGTQTEELKLVSELVQTELNHDFIPPDLGRLTQRLSSSRIATINENSSFYTTMGGKVDETLDSVHHGEPTPDVQSQRKVMNYSHILNSNRSNRSQRSHRPRSPAQQTPMKTLNDFDDGLDEGDIYDELPGPLSDDHESDDEMLADPAEQSKQLIIDDIIEEEEDPQEQYFKREFSQVDEEEELAEQIHDTIDLQEALNAQRSSVFHSMPDHQQIRKVEVYDEDDALNNSVQIQDGEQMFDHEHFLSVNQSMMVDKEEDTNSLRLMTSPHHERKKSKMQKKLEQYMEKKLSRNQESPDNAKVPDMDKGRRTMLTKTPAKPIKVETRFSNTMTSGVPLKPVKAPNADKIHKAIQSALPRNPRKSISGLSQYSVSSSKREITTKVIMESSPMKKPVLKTFGRVRNSEVNLKPTGLLQGRPSAVAPKSPSKADVQSKKKFGPKLVNSLEKKKTKEEAKVPSKEPFQINISEMDDVESLPGVAPISVASSQMEPFRKTKAPSSDYGKVVKKKMSKQVKGIVSRLTQDTVNSKLRKLSDPPF